MSRPATARLKVQPMRGLRPSLEFRPLHSLGIDPTYQRSIDVGGSQSLIRRIAMHWDWGLCQPLTVAKRDDGSLWVVDGQHRLAAARLRSDIYDLPCVVMPSQSADEEAATFVAMNQQRRPLSKLEIFRAALVAHDEEARTIDRALKDAGLGLATSTNPDSWKPGQVVNVGGLQWCLSQYGEHVLRRSCMVAAQAFADQVLRYFGTIFPGIAAAVARLPRPLADSDIAFLQAVLGGGTQADWVRDINRVKADKPDLNMRAAAKQAIIDALDEALADD